VDEDLRATLVPNAVDTERFRPASPAQRAQARAALGIANVGPVVLFASRLVPKKNLPALVGAMSRGDAHLLVVGDGPERGTLAALGARVTHLARIEHERMPEVFAAADLFVLPSVGEGLPLSLIEAMASGLPCVVSDDPAFAPLAPCGGVVRVPLRALAGAIAAALGTSDTSRQAQSSAVRSWAVERYSVASFSRRYLELIDEAARER
jgi:glycosyltransferase involved in cell wall biosynthesis